MHDGFAKTATRKWLTGQAASASSAVGTSSWAEAADPPVIASCSSVFVAPVESPFDITSRTSVCYWLHAVASLSSGQLGESSSHFVVWALPLHSRPSLAQSTYAKKFLSIIVQILDLYELMTGSKELSADKASDGGDELT